MRPRRILWPDLASSDAIAPAVRARKPVSTFHLGTAYELHTLHLLANAPYNMTLIRVGGANDRGVDLRGRWTDPSSSESAASSRDDEAHLGPRRRRPDPGPLLSSRWIPEVVVQCKAESKRLGPATLREFEGVLQNHHHSHRRRPRTTPPARAEATSPAPSQRVNDDDKSRDAVTRPPRTTALGILVSLSGFSSSTIERAHQSSWPMCLVHFHVGIDRLRLDESGKIATTTKRNDRRSTDLDKRSSPDLDDPENGIRIVSWTRNRAWKDLVALNLHD
ncbi:hypothetical protein JCM10212_004199 [Sporobolomyces blumeae]